MVRTAVRTRAVVQQATGMMMCRHACSDEVAFELSTQAAASQGLTVAQIAAAVVRDGAAAV
jgi:AmiR/NasT family two-component response regulator